MTTFRDEWDLEMALEVLRNKTVDGKLWAEAVKWLFLFGPPAIREILSQASSMATGEFFPDLAPAGYNEQGEPLYDIKKLSLSLGVSEEEIMAGMADLETNHDIRSLYDGMATHKIH